ncbi:MAG: hypothetical protein ACI9U2_004442 [Bradymonadia bacterium]|jgi:hypothetical protein
MQGLRFKVGRMTLRSPIIMGASAVVACALAGCVDVEAPNSTFGDQDAAVGFDMRTLGDGGEADVGGALIAPVGQWALFVEDRKCMSAIGAIIENVITSWYLVDVIEVGAAGDGQVLRKRVRLCTQTLSPLVGGLRTVVPQSVIERLPSLDMSGFLLGIEPGDSYLGAELVAYWGMTDIGIEGTLPTQGDPRIFDQDEDGHAGVSFITTNALGEPICDVRVVQRTRVRLDGQVDGSNRLSGSVWGQLDQNVVESSSPLCASTTEFARSPSPSTFVMVRVDGKNGADLNADLNDDGTIDCQDLRNAEAVIESSGGVVRTPPDDAVCR